MSNPSIKCATLVPTPAFEERFSRGLVDCVGLLPLTKSGFQYSLTSIDAATRFPEVIHLKKTTARAVFDCYNSILDTVFQRKSSLTMAQILCRAYFKK